MIMMELKIRQDSFFVVIFLCNFATVHAYSIILSSLWYFWFAIFFGVSFFVFVSCIIGRAVNRKKTRVTTTGAQSGGVSTDAYNQPPPPTSYAQPPPPYTTPQPPPPYTATASYPPPGTNDPAYPPPGANGPAYPPGAYSSSVHPPNPFAAAVREANTK